MASCLETFLNSDDEAQHCEDVRQNKKPETCEINENDISQDETYSDVIKKGFILDYEQKMVNNDVLLQNEVDTGIVWCGAI